MAIYSVLFTGYFLILSGGLILSIPLTGKWFIDTCPRDSWLTWIHLIYPTVALSLRALTRTEAGIRYVTETQKGHPNKIHEITEAGLSLLIPERRERMPTNQQEEKRIFRICVFNQQVKCKRRSETGESWAKHFCVSGSNPCSFPIVSSSSWVHTYRSELHWVMLWPRGGHGGIYVQPMWGVGGQWNKSLSCT